jgi:hypothetical protein
VGDRRIGQIIAESSKLKAERERQYAEVMAQIIAES